MPNWCQNEVTVSGDEDKLKEFKEYCYGEWYHGKCGDQTIWVVNKDATEPPYGEYKDNPDYCGGEEFLDTCDKVRQHFSFRSILPMPKEIEHTGSPFRIYDTQEELDEYIKEYYGSEKAENFYGKQIVAQAMTREYASYLERTYGADNWYDWSYENWGTKWDVSDVWLEDDGDSLQYSFDTAWCPPEGIHAFLVDKFPDITISWCYREEGVEMAGYL